MTQTVKTVPLAYPITHAGGTLAEIVLRRPRVRDVRALQEAIEPFMERPAIAADEPSLSDAPAAASPALIPAVLPPRAAMAASFALLASMNGLPPEVLDDLDIEDLATITTELTVFFPAARLGIGAA